MTAKPESSKINYLWMPDQVRHDGFWTFYKFIKIDSLVKSQKTSFFVIPAKAGIQCFQKLMTRSAGAHAAQAPALRVRRVLTWTPAFAGVTIFYEFIKTVCEKFK